MENNPPLTKKPIPAWAWSFVVTLVTSIALIGLGESGLISNTTVLYLIFGISIAIACFFICRQDPKSFWYVPVICNLMGILPAFVEKHFWISSMWWLTAIGWGLSIIGAVAGAIAGKKKS